jgi:glycosyltransferase involved in cell wall biosynthesis
MNALPGSSDTIGSAQTLAGDAPLAGTTLLILIGGHLATAPRPQKEARALREAGARVLVRGTWWDEALAAEDLALARALGVDYRPVVDLRGGGALGVRLRQRAARELFRRTGIATARAFGLGAPELLREALRIRADLTMVHSEAGLWAARELLARGLRVCVDFEDWFSQDIPAAERSQRPQAALQALERHLLREAQVCLAPTRCMAEALARDAGTDRIPVAIPNCFPAAEREAAAQGPRDPRPTDAVSFYWFSQTLGPGRGLETLAAALPHLQGNWHLALRGALRTHREWFERTFPEPLRQRLQVLNLVPNAELLSRSMSYDVGLALEEPTCPNKDLTASNKLFEYLRAGLAVIATQTQGQDEGLSACPEAGVRVPPSDPQALAQAMQKYLDDPGILWNARQRALEAGAGPWAWEAHAGRLRGALAGAMDPGPLP